MSMNPGATIRPCASMVFLREALDKLPMAAMRPSLTATSPAYHGEPVPSMIWPFAMTRSYSAAAASWIGTPARKITGKNARQSKVKTYAWQVRSLQVFVEPRNGPLHGIGEMLRIPQPMALARIDHDGR